MIHRRPLTVSLIVTIALAFAVLIAREQIVTGEADTAPPTATIAATEIPLVNLVQTADGRQVVVPAGSLEQQGHEGEERHDDHDDDHDDHEDDHDD
jgi:flagellar basal body-associated protein FliL